MAGVELMRGIRRRDDLILALVRDLDGTTSQWRSALEHIGWHERGIEVFIAEMCILHAYAVLGERSRTKESVYVGHDEFLEFCGNVVSQDLN
jgi:hypothetical protein